jgi:phage-related protein
VTAPGGAKVIASAAVRLKADATGLDRDVERDVNEAVDRAAASSRGKPRQVLPDFGPEVDRAEARIRAGLARIGDIARTAWQGVADRGVAAYSAVQAAAERVVTAVRTQVTRLGQEWERSIAAPARAAFDRVRGAWGSAVQSIQDTARRGFARVGDALEPISIRARTVAGRVAPPFVTAAATVAASFRIIGSAGSRAYDAVETRVRSATERLTAQAGELGRAVSRGWDVAAAGAGRHRKAVEETGGAFEAIGRVSRKVFDSVSEGGRRAGSAISTGVRGAVSAAQAAFTALGDIGGKVLSGLTSMASLLTVAIVAGAGALGGMVVAAPALLAGLAAPLGAVMLGMDGIKRAAQAVKPALTDLKKAVSESFEQSLRPAMQGIAAIIPKLTTGFKSIASALGGTATQMVAIINTGPGIQTLQGFLDGVSRAIQALQPGLVAGTQAFMRLVGAVTPALADIGSAIGSLASEWAGAINRMADLGILKDAIGSIAPIVRSLGQVFGQLIEVVGRLAATVGPGVAALIRGISDGLRGGQDSVSQFGAAVGRIFTALGPVIAKVVPLILKVAASFAEHLAPAVEKVAPFLEKAADALSNFAGPIGAVVGALVAFGVAAKVFSVISSAVGIVKTIATTLRLWTAAQWLLNFAMDANPIGIVVVAIAALVAGLIYAYQHSETFRNAVQTAFRAVGEAVQAVIQWFRDVGAKIGEGFDKVKTVVSNVVDAVVGFLKNWGPTILAVIAPVIGIPLLIAQHWDEIVAFFRSIPGRVSAALSALGDAIKTAVEAAVRFLAELPDKVAFLLGYLAGQVYNGARAAWRFLSETVPEAIQAAIDFLLTLPGVVVSNLVALGSAVASGARTAWRWLVTTATEAGTAVIAFVQALPGRIGAFLSALATTVINFARQAWQGFLTQTTALINNTIAFVSALPGRVKAGINALIGFVKETATNAWNGFKTATQTIANATLAFVQSIPGKIKAFFSGAAQWLVQAGRDVLQGLWNGMKAIAQGVLDWIGHIGSQIAAGFKAAVGIHSPSTVFHGFGVYIMEGLRNGIESQEDRVVAAMSRIAGKLAGAAKVAVQSTGLEAAAREVLARLTSGGQVFEDLTWRGASSNVNRYNEVLMDALRKLGSDGTIEGTEAALRRLLGGGRGGSSGRPAASPVVTADTAGASTLAPGRGAAAQGRHTDLDGIADAVRQGAYAALSESVEPLTNAGVFRMASKGEKEATRL